MKLWLIKLFLRKKKQHLHWKQFAHWLDVSHRISVMRCIIGNVIENFVRTTKTCDSSNTTVVTYTWFRWTMSMKMSSLISLMKSVGLFQKSDALVSSWVIPLSWNLTMLTFHYLLFKCLKASCFHILGAAVYFFRCLLCV